MLTPEERHIIENQYIEGLIVAINAASEYSPECTTDLIEDLFDGLMESRGFFSAIAVEQMHASGEGQFKLVLQQMSDGAYYIPVFTTPELLTDFFKERPNLNLPENPCAIMAFIQLYQLLKSTPEGASGIVLNPDSDDTRRVITLGMMEEAMESYHEFHDGMSAEELEASRLLWCMEDEEQNM